MESFPNGKIRKSLAGYYKGIMEALAEAFRGVDAYEEYCRLVEKNFGK